MEPTSFWVNPFGVAWPLLKASDLILVNKDGKVVDGGPVRLLNAAGTFPSLNSTPNFNLLYTDLTSSSSIHDPPRSAHSPPRNKLCRTLSLHLWSLLLHTRAEPRHHNARFLRLPQRYRFVLLLPGYRARRR